EADVADYLAWIEMLRRETHPDAWLQEEYVIRRKCLRAQPNSRDMDSLLWLDRFGPQTIEDVLYQIHHSRLGPWRKPDVVLAEIEQKAPDRLQDAIHAYAAREDLDANGFLALIRHVGACPIGITQERRIDFMGAIVHG